MPISNEFGSGIDRSYKFNGVMIGEDSNIIAMDNNLVNSGYESRIINLKRSSTKDEYNSNKFRNNMCLSREDFKYILDFSITKVKSAITRILQGEITPRPLVDGMYSTCGNCKYKALCHYSGGTDENIEKVATIEDLKNKVGGEGIGAK